MTPSGSVSIAADASDPEGQLARVEFYDGITLLGADSEAPYEFHWASPVPGVRWIWAAAVDGNGKRTFSLGVSTAIDIPPGGYIRGITADLEGGWRVDFVAPVDARHQLEKSRDLKEWAAEFSVTNATETIQFVIPQEDGEPALFWRMRQVE